MSSVNASSARVCKYGDQNMFLDIKRPRIHGELEPRPLEKRGRRQRPCHEMPDGHDSNLGTNRTDGQGVFPVPEELVDKGEQDA